MREGNILCAGWLSHGIRNKQPNRVEEKTKAEVFSTSERLLFDILSNSDNKRQQNASENGAEACVCVCMCVHVHVCALYMCICMCALCMSVCECAMHLYFSSNMKINFL